MGYKASIEVGKAKERLDVFDSGGDGPFSNACNFDWVHGKGTRFDDHSKVLDFMHGEGAFFELEIEVKFLHVLKDSLGAGGVVGVVVGVDKEVIHINDEPSFSYHISEGVGHESLEHGGRICHAKEHDCRFIEASVSNESGLPLVAFLDSDIVVPPMNIKLDEDLGVFEFVNEIGDKREGVCISDSVFIEISVVLAGSESAVLYLDKEERRSLRRFGQADFPGAEVFIYEFICGLLFFYQEGIEFPYLRDKGFVKVDSVVVGSGGRYVVCGFLGEYLGILSVLSGEGLLGFLSLGFHGKVSGHGEFINSGLCSRS